MEKLRQRPAHRPARDGRTHASHRLGLKIEYSTARIRTAAAGTPEKSPRGPALYKTWGLHP